MMLILSDLTMSSVTRDDDITSPPTLDDFESQIIRLQDEGHTYGQNHRLTYK